MASVRHGGKAHGIPACLRSVDGTTRDVTIDASSIDGGEVIYCAINDRSVQRRTEDHARSQAVFLKNQPRRFLPRLWRGL
jgi:hypothetical protein